MNTPRFYCGVGSRQTPNDILKFMTKVAEFLATKNFVLRSGHADGADWAFELGAGGKSVIYLPWKGFSSERLVYGESIIDNELYEKNYDKLIELKIRFKYVTRSAGWAIKQLHGRNYCQVLGHKKEDNPVEFVVCWCPEDKRGNPIGGTATAIKLAQLNNIPVYNLYKDKSIIDYLETNIMN